MLLKHLFDRRLLSVPACTNAPISITTLPLPNSNLTVQASLCALKRIHSPMHFSHWAWDVCSHTSPWWSMRVSQCFSVCVHAYQCRLCSAARGLEGGGGEPTLDAPLVFTLARLHPTKPCPCPLLEQTEAFLPSASARSGTYHSSWTQGQQPPHWLNGHTVETGLFGLTCPGAACSEMLTQIMKCP